MTGLDFLDRLTDGCSAAGAGFYFEEGGCWGMALALHDAEARLEPIELADIAPLTDQKIG